MPLRKQTIPVLFDQGLDVGGADPKLVDKHLLKAENLHVVRRGSVGKRPGTGEVSGAPTTETIMATYRDRPLILGDTPRLFTGETRSEIGSWSSIGPAGFCDISLENAMMIPGTFMTGGDVAQSATRRVFTFTESDANKAFYSEQEIPSGNWRFFRTEITGSESSLDTPRVLAVGTSVWVFWHDRGAGTIESIEFTKTGSITSGTIASNARTGGTAFLDCCLLGDGVSVAMVYKAVAAGTLRILVFNTSTVTSAATTVTGTSIGRLACFPWLYSNTQFGIMWVEESETPDGIYVDIYNTTPAQVSTAAFRFSQTNNVLRLSGVVYDTTLTTQKAFLIFEASLTQPDEKIYIYYVQKSGVNVLSSSTAAGAIVNGYLASKPFADSKKQILFLSHYSGTASNTTQRGYVLYRTNEDMESQSTGNAMAAPIGHSQPGFGRYAAVTTRHHLSAPQLLSDDLWQMAVGRYLPSKADATLSTFGVVRLSVDRNIKNTVIHETNSHLFISNSLPMVFDGATIAESGFVDFPDGVTVVAGGATASWSGTGNVSYHAVYEWIDAQGKTVRSARSPAVQFTIPATTTAATIVVPAPRVVLKGVWRGDNIRVVLYRTELNGQTFLRGGTGLVAEHVVLTTASYTFTDNGAASTSNDPLYTNKGEVDNIIPAPHLPSAIHQDRIFYVDRDSDRALVRYSKGFDRDNPPLFSDFFTIFCNSDGGPIEALASLDDKLVILKRNNFIFATQGQGLDLLAQGQSFTPPFLVSNTVGCTSRHTVALIPSGLVFLGQNGIYLLNRSLQTNFIGERVRHITDTYPLTDVNVVASENVVLWSSSGPTLVFNYLYDIWSTWHGDYDNVKTSTLASDVLYFHTGTKTLAMKREYFLDSTDAYSLTLETGWFSFAGVGGFSRLYNCFILGQNLTSHKLNVQFQYDFDPVWRDSQTVDATSLKPFDHTKYFGAGLDSSFGDQTYALEATPGRQKITSIRLRISDIDPDSPHPRREAMSLSGVAYLVGTKMGTFRVGQGRITR